MGSLDDRVGEKQYQTKRNIFQIDSQPEGGDQQSQHKLKLEGHTDNPIGGVAIQIQYQKISVAIIGPGQQIPRHTAQQNPDDQYKSDTQTTQ